MGSTKGEAGRQASFEHPAAAAGLGLLCVAVFFLVAMSGVLNGVDWLTRNLVELVLWAAAAGCWFVGAVRAFRLIARPSTTLVGRAGFALLGLGMALVGLFFALLALTGFGRGRQVRVRGAVKLPGLANGDDWAAPLAGFTVDPALAVQLATRWRENGKNEHASVAAFAHLSMELLALGAPPQLLEEANRAALEEIDHARRCFAVARAFDGQAIGPAPFSHARKRASWPRPRLVALAALAVDSLIDGALHEGASAETLTALVPRCEVPAIRAVLEVLATDEHRHAQHAWHVVAWCLAEGGPPVARALGTAAKLLSSRAIVPPSARADAWERFGLHGEDLEVQAMAHARAQVLARVDSLLASSAAPFV